MLISLFLLLDLSPTTFADELFSLVDPKESLQFKTQQIQKGKKKNLFARGLLDIQHMLDYAHQSKAFSMVVVISFVLAIIGVALAVLGNNPYLIFPLAIGFCAIPLIIVRLYSYSYIRRLQNELEMATSIITTTYLRNNDLVRAIEENIDYIKSPVKGVLQEFILENKFINPNVRQTIDHMKDKVDDNIFKEWCDAMKKCVANNSLKYMLSPVVEKYAKLRKINVITKPTIDGMKIQMFGVIGLVFVNFPLLKLMSNDSNNWYSILVNSTPGKITVAWIAAVTVCSVIRFVFVIKPTKYQV